jgi:hypothetical protein
MYFLPSSVVWYDEMCKKSVGYCLKAHCVTCGQVCINRIGLTEMGRGGVQDVSECGVVIVVSVYSEWYQRFY